VIRSTAAWACSRAAAPFQFQLVVTDQDHVVLAQDGGSAGCGRVPQPRVVAPHQDREPAPEDVVEDERWSGPGGDRLDGQRLPGARPHQSRSTPIALRLGARCWLTRA
jgi:hypothetical protein